MSSDIPPPDYDAIEREQWMQARKDVEAEAKKVSQRLRQRISTFVARFGYEPEEVISKIETDSMFAAHFAKEPRRTGLHEAVAAKWIRELPLVSDFIILPKAGEGAFKVTSDGNIVPASSFPNIPGKTLDFKWRTGQVTFYAMHKYTKESGGNQDSQYQEMVDLMKRFQHCRDEGVALLVIADGEYYKESGSRRLRELKGHERTSPPKSHALPIEELPTLLEIYERTSI